MAFGAADIDGDGLLDGEEVHQFGTNPLLPDAGEGGRRDGAEVVLDGTDPNDMADDGAPPPFPLALVDGSGTSWQLNPFGEVISSPFTSRLHVRTITFADTEGKRYRLPDRARRLRVRIRRRPGGCQAAKRVVG